MKKNNRIRPACPMFRNWGQERNWALLRTYRVLMCGLRSPSGWKNKCLSFIQNGWTMSEGRGIVRAERVRVSLFRSRDLACRLASRKASSRIFHYGTFSPSPLLTSFLTSLDPLLAVSTSAPSFHPLAVSPAMVRRKSYSVPSVFWGFWGFHIRVLFFGRSRACTWIFLFPCEFL